MATELGVGYISLVPDGSKLPGLVDKEMSAAGKTGGKAFTLGTSKNLGGVAKAFGEAGKDAGEAMAKAALAAAKSDVNKLGKLAGAATDKQADAMGRLRVAEAKLADIRANSSAKASQIAAAEEAVAAGRRRVSATTDAAKAASEKLTAAQKKEKEAVEALGKAQSETATKAEAAGRTAGNRFTNAFGKFFKPKKPAEGALDDIDSRKAGQDVAARFGFGFNGAIGSIVSRSAGVFAAGFAAVSGANFLKGTIDSASNLGETISKSIAVFGPAQKIISRFGDTAAVSIGQSEQQAVAAAAQFGNMFNQLGIGQTPAANMSTQMVKLASDFSSFHNADITEVLAAQEAAFRGEYDSVQRFVPTLNAAAVEQEGLRLKLAGSTKELTAQDKAVATHSLLLRGAGKATGDFGRTSTGLANQQRILSARFADFKTSIGAFALPLATKFFGFLNEKGIPALQEISGGIRAFGAAWKANDGDITSSGFPGFMENLAFQTRKVADYFTGTLLPAFGSFAGFIRENKGLILGLAGAYGGLLLLMKLHTAAMAVQAAGGFLSFLSGWFTSTKLIQGATKAWTAVQWALNVALNANPIGLLVIGIGLAIGAIVLLWRKNDAFRNALITAWNAIKTAAAAVWGGIKVAIGAVGAAFTTVKDAVGVAIGAMIAAFNAVKTAVTVSIGAIRSAWGAVVTAVSGPATAVVNVLQAIWSRVYPIIALPFYIAKKLISDFWAGVTTVFKAAASWVTSTFSKAWTAVSGVLSGPVNTAKTWIGQRIAAIQAGFTAAKNWVTGVFAKAWSAVAGVFTSAVNTAKNNIANRVDLIKGIFTAVKDWAVDTFAKAWSGLTAKLTGPVTAARNAITTILGSGKGGVQWVFSQAVSGIGKAWDGLKELAKRPIRFIIDTVLNSGLIGGFNWIAGKFGAPTIPAIPMPKGFAAGGKFTGRIPGPPSPVDNLIARGPGGRGIGLATGEFIVNAQDTARNLPLLKAINSGQGFADGGLFGKLKSGITGAFNAGKSFGEDVMKFLSDPVKWFKDRLAGPLNSMSELGDSPFAQVVKAVPRKLVDTVSAKAKDLLNLGGGGGPINPGLAGALNWARSQVGKPYIWGGVGPAGYDCSGFMSAIVNVIRGSNPFQRLFATGSLPAGMFAPGSGAFEIGWFTGNPGHVAGTLNGTNVESRGGRGVVVGPGARGAHDPLFNRHGHLIGYANGGIVGDPPFDLLDPRGKAYKGKAVLPRSALSFDNGGMLPTGYSMVHNGTGKPEPVGHDFLRKDDLNGMRIELDAGGVGTLTGYVRITAQDQIRESNRAIKRKIGR